MLLQLNNLLRKRLEARMLEGTLRSLKYTSGLVDFTSNDYLGLALDTDGRSPEKLSRGSTGSRLLTGHSEPIESLENKIAKYHHAEAALIFNTGYAANQGLMDSLLKEDVSVIYDLHCHASVQDGLRFTKGKSYPFFHNDTKHLKKRLEDVRKKRHPIFVVVESVYSMDGSLAPLKEMSALCDEYGAGLIVDEAHAIGVYGKKGEGRVVAEGIEDKVFARVLAYGKAFGVFGGAVLGSQLLKQYLINFARPFCYSTALPPYAIKAIDISYSKIHEADTQRNKLFALISYFESLSRQYSLVKDFHFSPIQSMVIPGNSRVKAAAMALATEGYDVRPILSPTVKKGQEILRLILHSFNTPSQVESLLHLLKGHL
ncbi:MAG: pyridoxal phosphate-dependent aminotransferase family protein [Parachlamydiales bacterium]|jgi:8-amino-7-oxononanoate synthase